MSRLNSSQVISSVLGYVQITANQSTTSTQAVATPGLSLTVTIPNLVGNQRVEIEFYCRDAFVSGGGIMDIMIWDSVVGTGGTMLESAEPNTPSGSAVPVFMKYSGTPSAGSHTFLIGFSHSGGTQAWIEASASFPAWMQVKVV